MYRDSQTKDNLRENFPNASSDADEDDTSQMVEMAAEQLADLIWNHWLYIQRHKKKKRSNAPES
jgi:hypothetical protein